MAEARGSILISTANKIGATLVKKLGGTGYTPSEWADKINLLGALPEDTVSGAIANFPDGAEDVPVAELISNIAPTQAGSGDPAPDNVRAISGFTGMRITKQGKNLIDDSKVYQEGSNHLVIGQTVARAQRTIFLKAGTYTVRAVSSEQAYIFYNNGSGSDINIGNTDSARSLTLNSDSLISIFIYSNNGYNTDNFTSMQIEVGSAATDYEPYSAPEVKSISWETEAGTVYGGSLNVTTGELTVTHVKETYSSGSGWTTNAQGFHYVSVPDNYKTSYKIILNAYKGVDPLAYQSLSANEAALSPTFAYVNINDNTKDTEAWDTFLRSNPLEIIYKLVTPQVYQLDPVEVNTLLGVNNFYNDTNGDTEVNYRADTDLYIAKKLAE